MVIPYLQIFEDSYYNDMQVFSGLNCSSRRDDDVSDIELIIVEDNMGHAGLIKISLEEEGISNNIYHFINGKQALDFLFQKGQGPHRETNARYILLLDIRMPGLSGIEVLKKIKGDKKLCRMPVIMLTTADDPHDMEQCYDLGCNAYMVKHVSYEKLKQEIRNLCMYMSVIQVPVIK